MAYTFKLPTDPPPDPSVAGRSYTFELTPAFWFGMAMCDDQSAPNPGLKCKPDSNSNIKSNPAKQPGSAYMEMQFYPPGWTPWPAGISCDPTKWCAALNIDSLSEDLLHGTTQNSACADNVTGVEYVNFAFITKNGKPQDGDSPNPVDSTAATFTPNLAKDLLMKSGDTIGLRIFDTASGLRIAINDKTSHASGSMTASAKNGFAEVKYAPFSGECSPIPTNYHPEYATTGPATVVPWAAHTYNVAMDPEIGHFDWCNTGPNAPGPVKVGGSCDVNDGEGMPSGPWRWSDGDDVGCFPASASMLVPVQGCIGENDPGFDGASYIRDWPDGNTNLHPSPILFTSPLTGAHFNQQYSRVEFQTDTPAIEIAPECYHRSGQNCTRLPLQDDGQPVQFYPFFWTSHQGSAGCYWGVGSDVPGMTKNDFGGTAQYRDLQSYVGLDPANPGSTRTYYENYGQLLPNNPCRAKTSS